ncbi:RICIN domain-containing protein [Lentzea sp. NPDC051208]|uniref:RICIN domain-containing protein n=1 Tax=Lentzea sp. NPDC051208 TaxID=3154642 RepID=UPI00342ACAF6
MRERTVFTAALLAAALMGVTGQAGAATPTGTITHHDQTGTRTCLDSPDHADEASGTRVILWDCHGGANQQWEFVKEAGTGFFDSDRTGVFRIGGKCLDAYGGSTAAGTPVILWDCHGGPNQRWTHYGLRGLITLAGTGSSACLVRAGSGTPVNGTQLVIAPCEPRSGAWELGSALLARG